MKYKYNMVEVYDTICEYNLSIVSYWQGWQGVEFKPGWIDCDTSERWRQLQTYDYPEIAHVRKLLSEILASEHWGMLAAGYKLQPRKRNIRFIGDDDQLYNIEPSCTSIRMATVSQHVTGTIDRYYLNDTIVDNVRKGHPILEAIQYSEIINRMKL